MDDAETGDKQPQLGDRVVSISGRRLGVVLGLNGNRFSISGRDGLWLDSTVIFHRQVTTVTLICEQEGLSRFTHPGADGVAAVSWALDVDRA